MLCVLQGDAREGDGEVNHAHHYIVAPPNGPTSEGVCKECGATRTFPNFVEGSYVADFNARRERMLLQKAGVR